MTAPAYSPRGARVRGALALLGLLLGEGRQVAIEGDGIAIRPGSGLQPEDLRMVKDLKAELMALLWFGPNLRAILAQHEGLNLEDLLRYRGGLEAWLCFTPEEQRHLLGGGWSPEDLQRLVDLKGCIDGQVIGPVMHTHERVSNGASARAARPPHHLKRMIHGPI